MRSLVVYPTFLKVLISLALICVVAFLVLLLSPLLDAFAFLFDIPHLPTVIYWMHGAAVLLLLISAPLAWALGFAGLMLEWMSSHRVKRKRKQKRQLSASDRERQRSSQAWAADELNRGRRAQQRLQAYVKGSAAADNHAESGLTNTRRTATWSARKT